MNLVKNAEGHIHVTLSRRNLETLVKMLDARVGFTSLKRVVDDAGTVLLVQAEENDEHYGSEARQEEARGKHGIGPDDVPDKV